MLNEWAEWKSLTGIKEFALDLQKTAGQEGSRKLDLVARALLTAVEATQTSGATDLLEQALVELKRKTDQIDSTPVLGVMKEFGMK